MFKIDNTFYSNSSERIMMVLSIDLDPIYVVAREINVNRSFLHDYHTLNPS